MGMLSTVAFSYSSPGEDALKGVESVKAVLDFRTDNAKMAAVFLEMIHETFKGKEIASVTKKTDAIPLGLQFNHPISIPKSFRIIQK